MEGSSLGYRTAGRTEKHNAANVIVHGFHFRPQNPVIYFMFARVQGVPFQDDLLLRVVVNKISTSYVFIINERCHILQARRNEVPLASDDDDGV